MRNGSGTVTARGRDRTRTMAEEAHESAPGGGAASTAGQGVRSSDCPTSTSSSFQPTEAGLSEASIAMLLEVLPPGPDARTTAVALLEACGRDANTAVNRYFTSGPISTVSATPASTARDKRPLAATLPGALDAGPTARLAKRGKGGLIGPPLAERVRPSDLGGLVGQSAFQPDSALGRLLRQDKLPSVILWGPPGCGKTTVAGIIARATQKRFVKLSATQAGVKEVRKVVEEANGRLKFGQATVLFLDEIHRWNKAQQDALLPHVESGLVTLVGATTENPSFSLNSALLSRCKVVVLDKLETTELVAILHAALVNADSGLPRSVEIADEVLTGLANMVDGDARAALNALELAVSIACVPGSDPAALVRVSAEATKEALQKTHLFYDRAGEEHYNIISALHKSMRGGDVDAALYWLARMLEAGEDARYVTRRLVRFASEDVGLADPAALLQATAAHTAAEKIGMPECDVIIAQAVAYLARAPKSIAVYKAYTAAKRLVQDKPADPVPLHIRNAPTGLMSALGYGRGYQYTPENGYTRGCSDGLSYFPDSLKGTTLFEDAEVEPGHRLHPH